MIAHATVGNAHVLLDDPAPGAASRCVRESCSCPLCGADLWDSGEVARPSRRDARAGLVLRCTGSGRQPCGASWPIRRGDPLENSR